MKDPVNFFGITANQPEPINTLIRMLGAGSPATTSDRATLIGISLGDIIVFGERMGKNKSEAYDTHRDPYPMASPALGF